MSAAMPTPGFDPRRSRWIPWAFVGGFAVVFVVNMLMIYYAVASFTGVTITHAYERGRGYDQVLAEAARQDALGWQPSVVFEGGLLRVVVTDRAGQPVSGTVEGVLQRPLQRTALPLAFAPRGAGRWVAEVQPPEPGQWEARLTLFGADGTPFDIRHRMVVR